MVTVLESRHLKYKINDNDHNPPHVHVEGLGAKVRINLYTFEPLDSKTDFSHSILKRIIEFVKENREILLEEWESIHGKGY